MKGRFRTALGLLAALSIPLAVQAHGGRTDSLGCHHNRKAGGYHCHSGQLAGQSFTSKSAAQAALRNRRRTPQTPTQTRKRPGRVIYQPITTAQAKNHVGETAMVCGKVVSARYASRSRGRPTFLNLDKPYPNQSFTVVIWGTNRAAFGKPEKDYDGKDICVTGKIDTYRGVPQIEAKAVKDIVLKGKKIKEN